MVTAGALPKSQRSLETGASWESGPSPGGGTRTASEAEWGELPRLRREPAEHTPLAPAQSARGEQNENATCRTGDQICKITYLMQD